MKSLKQYLAESEKTYGFRLRTVAALSDEQLDKLEKHLARYNVESVSAPKTSIIQKSPFGFGDIGPSAVTTIDIVTNLPTTPNVMQEEIAAATGISIGSIRVYNEGQFVDEQEDLEEDSKDTQSKSLLADADYSESEKVSHKDNFGNEFVSNFVKNLPKSKLSTEYKVT
jgi:hypothetical protein|tara:strand:- start:44 stop:550 length:507 start_codon:yes stop_codon:yes gene_type:complete